MGKLSNKHMTYLQVLRYINTLIGYYSNFLIVLILLTLLQVSKLIFCNTEKNKTKFFFTKNPRNS